MHRAVVVRHALKLAFLVAFVVVALSACGGGGGGEEANKPRPLPEVQQVLRPGEYRTEEFEPSFSFKVGKGWKNDPPEAFDILLLGQETGGWGAVNVQRVYKASKSGTPIVVNAPKDLVGWLEHHPYLKTSDPEPISVGGVKGLQLDVA